MLFYEIPVCRVQIPITDYLFTNFHHGDTENTEVTLRDTEVPGTDLMIYSVLLRELRG